MCLDEKVSEAGVFRQTPSLWSFQTIKGRVGKRLVRLQSPSLWPLLTSFHFHDHHQLPIQTQQILHVLPRINPDTAGQSRRTAPASGILFALLAPSPDAD